MKPVLGPDWDLRFDEGRTYLYRRQDKQTVGTLTAVEAAILGLMDGSRSIDELAKLLASLAGEAGTNALYALVARLRPLLVSGYRRKSSYTIDALVETATPDSRADLRPLPGPIVLHWWVTNYCPRQCIYCFAVPKLGSRALDSVLTRDVLKRIFKEAATLGATSLLLSGGEPLLRTDLPEVMGDAIAQGIMPLLTTKQPVTRSMAQRFAKAGVRHISLSLDTLDEKKSRVLIGSNHYPLQVRRSVQNLVAVNLAFSIQAVATRMNFKDLSAVAGFAADVGAKLLQIVPFEPVRGPRTSETNDAMILKFPEHLEEKVTLLADQFPELRVELFEELGRGSRSKYQCDVGMTKLFFLPDGVVHRCYKLIRDYRLRGMDLREVSVAAAWHDPEFGKIISIPRESYVGSECQNCHQFNQCSKGGRCIYEAWITQGRFAARDRACDGPY